MRLRGPSCNAPWVNKFHAAGPPLPRKTRIELITDGRISIPAARVDTISETGDVWDPHWLWPLDLRAAFHYLSQIIAFCTASTRVDQGDVLRHATQIAVADATGSFHHLGDEYLKACDKWYNEFLQQVQDAKEAEELSVMEALYCGKPSQEQLYPQLLHLLHSRMPFISSTGYVGLCPKDARPGDVICIFDGGQIPYIVRPAGETYNLVGDAYVHGIMYGEFMDEKWDEEIFILS